MILNMNNFSCNDKHYLQTHGTALGTVIAPSYANFFVAKFDTDALSRAPFQPFIWWRYIDDIFMIWTWYFPSQLHSPYHKIHIRLIHIHTLSGCWMSTSYLTMAQLSLTFTPNLQKKTNTYYIRHIIPYTPERAISFSLALRLRRICSSI